MQKLTQFHLCLTVFWLLYIFSHKVTDGYAQYTVPDSVTIYVTQEDEGKIIASGSASWTPDPDEGGFFIAPTSVSGPISVKIIGSGTTSGSGTVKLLKAPCPGEVFNASISGSYNYVNYDYPERSQSGTCTIYLTIIGKCPPESHGSWHCNISDGGPDEQDVIDVWYTASKETEEACLCKKAYIRRTATWANLPDGKGSEGFLPTTYKDIHIYDQPGDTQFLHLPIYSFTITFNYYLECTEGCLKGKVISSDKRIFRIDGRNITEIK